MKEYKIFRIFDSESKLFSKGGQDCIRETSSWSKRGKTWVGLGPLKTHLRQYIDITRTTKKVINNIPETWEVHEYSTEGLSGVKIYSAKSLFS